MHIESPTLSPRRRAIAGLLGIYLGAFGVHRFYLGYTAIGVIQVITALALAKTTYGTIFLWGMIEGILIVLGARPFRTDAAGRELR
ncbi:TM2 domain-containing protein [Sinomonas sp. ASV322]|uniref:TM2 domain-containing protein n=1 Tax=Sinomonas sp. ASV322 TaxID=3041920 RepID=UPI0027DBE820|nr:TM2 domain-containing protein [Sinomonas sp. ASV322]MDQ4503974.1 TM2 domain-containing protein [Sinomonas sp. ASV322]